MRRPVVAAVVALFLIPAALAHGLGGDVDGGGPYVPPAETVEIDTRGGENPCDNAKAEWRPSQRVEGVDVAASLECTPDDPRAVAAFVKGTNRMPQQLLDDIGLHEDAVVKDDDLDGDGDPDIIRITLEVIELNGWHLVDDALQEPYEIAPGIAPTFWVFAPKTTIHHSGPFFELARMPTPPIRVEVGDQVFLTVENTHYLPHTIHLHGTDHPFQDAEGNGNDGVPVVSEMPILPGDARTYELKPRVAGSFFYHCHVQVQVHVGMGLGALFIIEENRPDNWLQTLNPGAGPVRHPSVASRERYDREYDMLYQDIDKELTAIPKTSNDARVISERIHRDYDATDAASDYFLLNGRSFPYTLRESTVVVSPNETVLLRVQNVGGSEVALHTHGHKGEVINIDGVPVQFPQIQDIYPLTAARRLDVVLNTTDDGFHSYGQGLWLTHDHHEVAVTTDGINPGGDITLIAYEDYLDPISALPKPLGGTFNLYFNPAYYRGEIPVFQMSGLDFLGQAGDPNAANASNTANASPASARTALPDESQRVTSAVPAPALMLVLSVIAGAALAAQRRQPR